MLDYEGALALLDSRASAGIKPGLERVSALVDALAAPHEGYPIVHVAGTNGKTSTARMAAALASAHGLNTGLFVSPELEAVEDQFEYGGHPMTAGEFVRAVEEIEPVAQLVEGPLGEQLTPFELLTALAFSWFAERSVDLAVVEAGLGGAEDSTNVASSEVAVVTGVGLEHQGFLGGTIEEIAAHKLGILDPGATLVTGPLDPEPDRIAQARVAEMSAGWYRFGVEFRPDDVQRAVAGWLFDIEGVHEPYTEIALGVRGRHQVVNFTVAVAAVEALLGRGLDEAAVREVAATIRLPGRMEAVAAAQRVLLDAAHNPEGMAALVAALQEEEPNTLWTVVFGAMQDKDTRSMLEELAPVSASMITTAAATPRAADADELADMARTMLAVPVIATPTVDLAIAAAQQAELPILVTGSVALVGEARKALRQ